MGKKKQARDYIDALRILKSAGLEGSPPPNRPIEEAGEVMPSLEERLKNVLGIVNHKKRKASQMLFFVMYDIESNKVRRYVVKYLERQGCTRVQKSIFLADMEMSRYEEIKTDLAEVQAAYENEDSILVVPISTDYLRAMKIIGQNINVDIITHSKSTLFF